MLERLKEEERRFKETLREKIVGYFVAALGLVAGLAWNDAVKAAIDYTFPLSKDGILAKFFYAAVVTIVIVLATIILLKFLSGSSGGEKK